MMETNPKKYVFSIGVVQKLTGLSGRQIRYYESAGLVHPHRSEGNQRLYSFDDIHRLHTIKRLMNKGYNTEGVRARLHEEQSTEPHDETSTSFSYTQRPGRRLIGRTSSGEQLSSLFPVNNQAELFKFLQNKRKNNG